MTVMAPFAPPTAKTVRGQTIHFSSTVNTRVGSAQRRAKTEANGYSDGGIIHAKA